MTELQSNETKNECNDQVPQTHEVPQGKKNMKIFMKKYCPLKTPIEMGKQRVRSNRLLNIPKLPPKCIERFKPFITIRKLKSKNRVHPRPEKTFEDNYETNAYFVPPNDRMFYNTVAKKAKAPLPFMMSEVKTTCEIDPNFFTIVDGRPVRDKVDIKTRMVHIREILLNKANLGYIQDQIQKIDAILGSSEKHAYKKILNMYHSICVNYQTFLMQSLDEALKAQSLGEKKFEELQTAMEVLEDISYDYNRIRNEVANLTIRSDILTNYRKFLFEISPIWWRAKHDTSFNDTCFLFQDLFTESETQQGSQSQMYRKSLVVAQSTLKVELFFESPEQIYELYESIQKQCLNYMHIRVMEKTVLDPVIKVRDQLKKEMVTETKFMNYLVSRFTQDIEMMEANEQTLKRDFFNLLMKKFRQLYVSFFHTKLFICLQYINTKVLQNIEDPNDSVYYVMRLIERNYDNIMLYLENLDQTIVKEATKEAMAYDKFILKRANDARATLKIFDNMEKALYASYEPPRPFKRIDWTHLKKKGKV